MTTLKLAAIRIDGGTQSRAELNQATVSEYAEAMTEGSKFPPVTVFFDGVDHWLGDGFHRFFGAKNIGALDIDADVRDGTKRDAVLFSLGANAHHGLRRTNADKRKAVETLLSDAEWAKWSDRQIAKACGVGHPFVASVRGSLESDSSEKSAERTYTTKHGTTAVMKTENIGKAAPAPTPAPVAAEEDAPATEEDDAANDEGATLTELVDELQSENTRLTAEITAIAGADDQKAETLKWHRMYDHAMRRQSEAEQSASRHQKESKRLALQVRECCRALGLNDPRRLVPEVKKLASRQEAA